MHTNMISTIVQEQEEALLHQHNLQQPHDDDDESTACAATTSISSESSSNSFPQRIWRFVRESVLLTRSRRKVRSASYSPETDAREERPRQSKKRAKSCGYESDGRRAAGAAAAEKEHRTAFMTANAWRKSKMLQELEASTERGRTCCMPTTAILRDKQSRDPKISHASARPVVLRLRAAAQTKCRNCGQLFFISSTAAAVEPQQSAPEFCSLDCKSTFQYLRTMQSIVNERIDEEENDEYGNDGQEEMATL